MDAVAEVAAASEQVRTELLRPGHEASLFSEAIAQRIGWSKPDQRANSASRISLDAKIAALLALQELPPFAPVASVDYVSGGNLLVLADSTRGPQAIDALADKLALAMLWTGSDPAPVIPGVEIVVAHLISLTGYLGQFEANFQPSGGITQSALFDLVLDLRREPVFRMQQPPQGYFHAADSAGFALAVEQLPEMIGEFDKPKFFAYKESLCAHSRSKKSGCNQCIDICSANAISSAGDTVVVDAHLCMGCGACATVCPSGAMTYQYPRVADRGSQLKLLLNSYRLAAKGQGETPTLLFHNATDGRDGLVAIAKSGGGIPAHMLPLETWHVASTGLDVLMGAIAYGAGHVAILAAGSETPEYVDALKREMALGQIILNEMGYAGIHFSVIPNVGVGSLGHIVAGQTVPVPAGFNLSNDKRGSLEFVIEHLLKHAPKKIEQIALPAGSLFGSIKVDTGTCTLCMACAGACPESALMDGADYPRLNFLERNCVQCGLCENTCPENAITLNPRLLLTETRKQTVVLNESEPFNCISCGKALGTRLMIDNMLGKLVGHSMFQGEGQLKRLQMCADCRVVDMMSNKREASILTGRPIE